MTKNSDRAPFLLHPVAKDRIWGGDRLIRLYGKPSDGHRLAESWELVCRTDGKLTTSNVIRTGAFAGITLFDYLKEVGSDAVAPDFKFGASPMLPLLIKLIDASDRLSLQVHPPREEGGKDELWYVIDCEPGAELCYGIREGISPEEFRRAVLAGDCVDCFQRVPVSPGDAFFIPAGLPHAIGNGILIAEIQDNSDFTYRLYDYGRCDASGNPRTLHKEEGLRAARFYSQSDIREMQFAIHRFPEPDRTDASLLADAAGFFVKLISLQSKGNETTLLPSSDRFSALLVLSGQGCCLSGSEMLSFRAGDCVFLPAKAGPVALSGCAKILLAGI